MMNVAAVMTLEKPIAVPGRRGQKPFFNPYRWSW